MICQDDQLHSWLRANSVIDQPRAFQDIAVVRNPDFRADTDFSSTAWLPFY